MDLIDLAITTSYLAWLLRLIWLIQLPDSTTVLATTLSGNITTLLLACGDPFIEMDFTRPGVALEVPHNIEKRREATL